jgi:hypothetical protein
MIRLTNKSTIIMKSIEAAEGSLPEGQTLAFCRKWPNFSGGHFRHILQAAGLAFTFFLLAATRSTAQEAAAEPANAIIMPDDGYWQVITDNGWPQTTTVQFYDLERHLIYEEKLVGVELDLQSRKTLRKLNRILQAALVAWRENGQLMKEKGIVAMRFKP